MAGSIDRKLHLPGGYKADSIKIANKNVLDLLVEFNIYESLVKNIITADITIADSHNLLSNLPIQEGTNVTFEVSNLPDDMQMPEPGEIKHRFEVVKVTNRKTLKQDLQVYTLILASSGWSSNIKKRISRSFRQKKYSEIAQEIFDKDFSPETGLLGGLDSKELSLEETDGKYNIVIPRWKPLTIFNWLAARSIKEKAVNFLFWEDLESFHFKPVEKLLEAGPVAKYYQQTQNISGGSQQESYFNAEEVNFHDTMDILFYGLNGMLGNRMFEFDLSKKIITDFTDQGKSGGHFDTDTPFDYQESFGSLKHADDNGEALVKSYTSSEFQEHSKFTVLPKHTYMHDDLEHYENEKWLRERLSQRAALDYFGLTLWTMGSFKRKVGDKIEFKYHSPESQKQQDPTPDKKVSGNYLVKSIRRKFNQNSYSMVMDCVKDDSLEL